VYGVKRKFLIFLYRHIVLRLFVCKLKEKEEKKEEGEEKISNKQYYMFNKNCNFININVNK
jgi:hypothetical protein